MGTTDNTTVIEQLKKSIKTLESRINTTESKVDGLVHLMEPNELHRPVTEAQLITLWNTITRLQAKKRWDHEEIRSLVHSSFFLTDAELISMDRLTGVRHAWVVLSSMLSNMRLQLVTSPIYDDDLDVQFLSRQVHATMVKVDSAVMKYMFLYRQSDYREMKKIKRELVPIPGATISSSTSPVPTHL